MKKTGYPEKLYKTTGRTLGKIEKYRWKYRNLFYLLISLIIAYYILRLDVIVSFVQNLGYWGYSATFIVGMFFTYGLTTAPATAAIYNLGQVFNPLLIAFIGAFGSVISDYLIFKFVKDRLAGEIILLSKHINRLRKPISGLILEERLLLIIWRKVSRSKIWSILTPVIAGFIIASPLPDELGVAIFGVIKFNPKKFVVVAYLLNFIGILFIAFFGKMAG